jgi:hypothetical protein
MIIDLAEHIGEPSLGATSLSLAVALKSRFTIARTFQCRWLCALGRFGISITFRVCLNKRPFSETVESPVAVDGLVRQSVSQKLVSQINVSLLTI